MGWLGKRRRRKDEEEDQEGKWLVKFCDWPLLFLRFCGLLKIYTGLGGRRCQRHSLVFYQVSKDDAGAAGVFVVRHRSCVPGN